MKRILPYFQYLANVAFVILIGETFDLKLFQGGLRSATTLYLTVALVLHGLENWLFDKLRGKD